MTATDPSQTSLQLTADGQLRHFLTLDGLNRALLTEILDTADSFIEVGERSIKKVPLLRGRTVVNLFFESSTRTRSTFELAAKRLSADVLNLDINTSATSKGESLSDTLLNLEAMASDMFVVRHSQSGAPILSPRVLPLELPLLMPATVATPTQPRPCWTCSPFASTRADLRA